MGRKSKAKFELKGHTLPGINQKSETANIKDGRSSSSAFQMKEDSPLNINWGRAALGIATGGMSEVVKGAKNLLGKKGSDEGSEGGKLLEDTGKTVEKTTGFTVSGGGDGGDGGDGDAGTTMPEAGGGDAATNKPDEVLTMKSPNKKKLKTGTKTKIGGKLNEGTSPHQNL
jgi:hypothetical protein